MSVDAIGRVAKKNPRVCKNSRFEGYIFICFLKGIILIIYIGR